MYFISVKEPLVTKKNLTVIPSRSPFPFLLSECTGRLPRMSPARLHFSYVAVFSTTFNKVFFAPSVKVVQQQNFEITVAMRLVAERPIERLLHQSFNCIICVDEGDAS